LQSNFYFLTVINAKIHYFFVITNYFFKFAAFLSFYLLMSKNKRLTAWIIVAVVLIVAIVGYMALGGEEEEEEYPGEYKTLTIQPRSYPIEHEFTTTIESENPVKIVPQVAGTVSRICVSEGAEVKRGQTLFIIDQVPYQAEVRSAEAALSSAEAELATSRLNLDGKEHLYKEEVIGEYDLRRARNECAVAEANLANAKADLAAARNRLSYTVIKSPIDGVIGIIDARVGDYVEPLKEAPLATVSDNKTLYAYFTLSEEALLKIARELGCQTDELPQYMPALTLKTNWGETVDENGHMDAVSGNVDEYTGSVILRASFDNSRHLMRNGSNGSIAMPYTIDNAIVIPQEATFEIQDKKFVYKVVDGKTQSAVIEVMHYEDGDDYVVTKGLKAGDIIIAEGAGLVNEGEEVKP